MAKIAYVRVSTVEQNIDRQEIELEKVGIDKYFIERKSGKNMDREEFKKMLEYIRDGDTLYIESLSRLARSTADLLKIAEILKEKNVELISLKEQIDTGTPQGKLVYTLFGALAEFERDCLLQRQKEGIAAAHLKGVHMGRPKAEYPNEFISVYNKWKNEDITAVEAMKLLKLKKSTFYNLVKKYESDREIKGE